MSTAPSPAAPGITVRGVTDPWGQRRDLFINQGVFVEEPVAGALEVDADGLHALPGLVDLHTHLREPGFEAAETVLTGTRAAAAGGYTAVFAMANTAPVSDTAGVVEQVYRLGRQAGYAQVRPIGAVTRGLAGEDVADLAGMAVSSAAVRVFSDDGHCVTDPALMRQALRCIARLGGVLAQHAQEPRLTVGAQLNEGDVSVDLGLAGWPGVAEETIIARDVLLAREAGAKLHVCHLSTAESVEVVRWAKGRGIAVTAEVTPHHLLLTDENARIRDAKYKVNPPLRTDEDVYALRAAVAEGIIDIIATDHAPHPESVKTCAWEEAANGMVGLETALSVVQQTLVDEGHIGWAQVAELMSRRPANIGQLAGYGTPFGLGQPAHLTLHDPAASRTLGLEHLRGKSINSPYLGYTLPGRVMTTILGGKPTVLEGKLKSVEEVRGKT